MGTEESDDVRAALQAMSEATDRTIEERERDGRITADDARHLRARYTHLHRLAGGTPTTSDTARSAAERDVLAAQRAALIDLRTRGEIDNTVQRKLLRVLDLEEERFAPQDDESENGANPRSS